ncbi:TetR/AcrR family transcriptional regulator [Candidatus Binatus soli]|jgi:AcrR family transcriptional regulator|uniref:TetR/AcrR family transcriptional regulator n=1 Tax=Candidatus Binatus soli TaxID=1953413 RepID=UPI003D0C7B17
MGALQVKQLGTSEPRTQSQDSRDEILKAAMQLFANRGFHETSMSEVAREARVSKALIFWHFKTKEELFVAVLNRLLEPYFIDFAEEAAMDERAQIEKLAESYLSFVRDNASSVRFFLAQMLHDERLSESLNDQVLKLYSGYRAMLVELIARAQQKGICTRRTAPESAAAFLLSALNGLLIEYLFMGENAVDPEGAVAMVGEWLFGAPPGSSSTEGGGAPAA